MTVDYIKGLEYLLVEIEITRKTPEEGLLKKKAIKKVIEAVKD